MKQELIEYGLSEKEAEVFLSCIKIGEATANRISELVNLPRSTTYDILEKLKHRGLVTTCMIKNKTHFIASDPKALLINLEEKKQKINKILPKLNEIKNKVKTKPLAEIFQGKMAMIKLLDEVLDNAKEIKVMGSQGNALEKIEYHPEKFRIKRLEKKIKIKQILEISKESKKIPQDRYTEIRFLKSLNNSKEGTFIYEDVVIHFLFQYELTAIKIISKEHAMATEIIFDELWKKVKKS